MGESVTREFGMVGIRQEESGVQYMQVKVEVKNLLETKKKLNEELGRKLCSDFVNNRKFIIKQ